MKFKKNTGNKKYLRLFSLLLMAPFQNSFGAESQSDRISLSKNRGSENSQNSQSQESEMSQSQESQMS
jgi:hypothetical protein